MATKVIFTDAAQEQLDKILDHFEYEGYNDNVVYDFRKAVLIALDNIRIFPRGYPKYHKGKLKGYRKISIKKYHYLIFYIVDGNTVYVKKISHMKQNYINELIKD